MTEYESELFDSQLPEQIISEIESDSDMLDLKSDEQEIKSQKNEVSNTIIIRQDGASQIDVSKPQKLQIAQPQVQIESTQSRETLPASKKKEVEIKQEVRTQDESLVPESKVVEDSAPTDTQLDASQDSGISEDQTSPLLNISNDQ